MENTTIFLVNFSFEPQISSILPSSFRDPGISSSTRWENEMLQMKGGKKKGRGTLDMKHNIPQAIILPNCVFINIQYFFF